jgi:hypothetical protein
MASPDSLVFCGHVRPHIDGAGMIAATRFHTRAIVGPSERCKFNDHKPDADRFE